MDRPHILAICFDDDDIRSRPFDLPEDFEWNDSGFARAATAYRRTCGWDFVPGKAGLWLCYYVITDGSGSDKGKWWYNGNLIGFAILYDRNSTGIYTSLAH